jgi:hypothetical protein
LGLRSEGRKRGKEIMGEEKEQPAPEPEKGREDQPEVFVPLPMDRVSFNSQDGEKAQKP